VPGGGFLPYQAGRFLHAFDMRAEPKARLRGTPQDSLARLHYDTIVHSSRALEFLIATAGAQHVLLGGDYPFDMGELDCVTRVEALPIPRTQRDAVLGRRAEELLGNVRP
jgi:aminocarboxymuconate-semialdehyde decarboxylase